LLEHLLIQNLSSFYDVGDHNEIRLRGADWNDALDMAAQRGESVAFTTMYADNMDHIAGLLAARPFPALRVPAPASHAMHSDYAGYSVHPHSAE
jgi:cellobiose phosphorylase